LGHNDTPFGRPTPQGVFDIFSYYQLVILIFDIVPLIMESYLHDVIKGEALTEFKDAFNMIQEFSSFKGAFQDWVDAGL
jgi:hypothetical protein